jgi:hypothetical protein
MFKSPSLAMARGKEEESRGQEEEMKCILKNCHSRAAGGGGVRTVLNLRRKYFIISASHFVSNKRCVSR